MEIWKEIKDFSKYEVSSYGRIKSLYYGKEKIMKQKPDKDGYLLVNLYLKKKSCTKKVHRLVLEHFKNNKNNKETVNHKDGIKTNNHIDNLEWSTRSENNFHAFRTGLRVQKAEHCKKKVLIYKDMFSKEYNSIRDAGVALNLDENLLSKVCRGLHKTHRGFKAKFI